MKVKITIIYDNDAEKVLEAVHIQGSIKLWKGPKK